MLQRVRGEELRAAACCVWMLPLHLRFHSLCVRRFPRRFLSHLAMVALPPISQTGFHAIFTDMVRRNMSTVTTMPVALVSAARSARP